MSPAQAPVYQQPSAANNLASSKAHTSRTAGNSLSDIPRRRQSQISRTSQASQRTVGSVPIDNSGIMEASGSVMPPDSVNVRRMDGIVPPREMRHYQTREALKSRDRTIELTYAARRGKLPTNAQATAALDRLTRNGSFNTISQGLSPSGQKLVRDAEDLIRATRDSLIAKNDGDYLQESLYFSREAANDAKMSAASKKKDKRSSIRDRNRADLSIGKDALHRFASVARLMASSNEFRQLISEFYSIIRDTVSDNLPTDEKGRNVARDTMDDAANRTLQGTTNATGSSSTMSNNNTASTSGMRTDNTSASGIDPVTSGMVPTDQYPNDLQPQPRHGRKAKGKKATLKDTSGSGNNNTTNGGSLLPSSTQEGVPGTQQSIGEAVRNPGAIRGNQPETSQEEVEAKMRDAAHPIVDSVISVTAPHLTEVQRGDASIGEKARLALKSSGQALNRNLRDVKLTQEQKDRLFERFKHLLQAMQSNTDYQHAISNLIDLLSHLASRTGSAAQRINTQALSTHEQSSTQRAEENARQLLENFAGGRSLEPLLESIADIKAVIRDDSEARNWLKEVKNLIRSSAREPTILDDPNYREKSSQLMDTGRELFGDRYQPHARELSNQTSAFLQGFAEDPLNKAFTRDAKKLVRDVFINEEGNPTLKPELVQDVATLMVRLVSKLKYIPMPRMEILDKDTDLVLDDLVLYADDIIPDQLQFRTATAMDIHHPGGKGPAVSHQAGVTTSTAVRVIIDRIKVETKDAAFYVNHKTTPRIANRGLVDFDMNQGRGVRIDMIMSMATKASDGSRYIGIDKIKVDISGLRLKFHGTGHDSMYQFFSPIINSMASKQIKKAMENLIRDQLTPASERAPKSKSGSTVRLSGMSIKDGENLPQPLGMVDGTLPGEPQWSSHAYDIRP
ncbi:MAG: hypothetical protein DHS80DRAFT_33134 [Piptocephalis tieghemiana]|nr:MAG: hypothetical protein DHS80DRAFT_33134 [Piptocephalis tieghemiana]